MVFQRRPTWFILSSFWTTLSRKRRPLWKNLVSVLLRSWFGLKEIDLRFKRKKTCPVFYSIIECSISLFLFFFSAMKMIFSLIYEKIPYYPPTVFLLISLIADVSCNSLRIQGASPIHLLVHIRIGFF